MRLTFLSVDFDVSLFCMLLLAFSLLRLGSCTIMKITLHNYLTWIAESELDITTVEQKNTSFVAQWYIKRLVLTKFCPTEQKFS